MRKRFKILISILLLTLFPISSIGLNFFIHKCQHTGAIHFTIFETFKSLLNSDCCCSGSGEEKVILKTEKNCCSQNSEVRDSQTGEDLMNSENSDNAKSCCKSKNDEQENGPINNSDNSKSSQFVAFTQNLNPNCCSNLNVNYIVSSDFLILDFSKEISENPIPEQLFLQKNYFESPNLNKSSNKELIFPLKEPICNIISFIHFTSDSKDTPAPIPFSML